MVRNSLNETQELKHLSLVATYEVDDGFDSDKFIKLRLRVCHDGKNPNQSYFELENIDRAKGSLANVPILAHVVEDDEGNLDFGGHDITLEKNKIGEGDDYKVIYLEAPIGLVPETNNYAIEEHKDRNYVYCDCYVWRDYSNYAEDIIDRDKELKLSMEILVDKYEYDVKEKYLNIIDYRYQGVTLLGKDYGTGMIDALATTETFATNNKEKFIMMMEELKNALSESKGGNEVDGQVEEKVEMEAKVDVVEPKDNTEEPKKYVKSFEISHEDVRYALYMLLEPVETEDNEWYWIDTVFDDRFEYSNWPCTKIYRQHYKVENDVVSFEGDRIELFQERLTKEEKEALDSMRENYAALEEENKTLKKFQEDKLKEEREKAEEELFSQFDEQLKDNEEYGKLKKNASQFELGQLEKEIALIVVKSNSSFKFSAKPVKKNTVKIDLAPKEDEQRGEYDELFDKYLKGGK